MLTNCMCIEVVFWLVSAVVTYNYMFLFNNDIIISVVMLAWLVVLHEFFTRFWNSPYESNFSRNKHQRRFPGLVQ